jgi:hypothetical protein
MVGSGDEVVREIGSIDSMAEEDRLEVVAYLTAEAVRMELAVSLVDASVVDEVIVDDRAMLTTVATALGCTDNTR